MIDQLLDAFFPDPKIPLEHTDPFTLLIAVLLSAQCTDSRVNQVTPHLFALASSPEEMQKQDPKIVEAIIHPCGLAPTKSRAIVRLCQQLVERFGGKVPADFDALESLSGIGHKSASVVMAQAFQIPAFPVDTHIHRLAKRWKLSDGSTVAKTEQDLKRFFKKSTWIKRHLQIIYYARKFCKARGHEVRDCPICAYVSRREEL
jgi:endonuclease-3